MSPDFLRQENATGGFSEKICMNLRGIIRPLLNFYYLCAAPVSVRQPREADVSCTGPADDEFYN